MIILALGLFLKASIAAEPVSPEVAPIMFIFLLPLSLFFEQPWNLTPRLDSTISLIYLGVFATGIAWLLRFYILKNNGLVFQAQVAYLIPIFGVILGFLFLKEEITPKVIVSLIAVIIVFYIVKKGGKIKVV